jgi:hypothetical protein
MEASLLDTSTGFGGNPKSIVNFRMKKPAKYRRIRFRITKDKKEKRQ